MPLDIPPALRERIRQAAEQDLRDIQQQIKILTGFAQDNNSFDDHIELIVALLMKYGKEPVTLAMLLTESIFLLAERDHELEKPSA